MCDGIGGNISCCLSDTVVCIQWLKTWQSKVSIIDCDYGYLFLSGTCGMVEELSGT